jgi:glycerophosphoryl diester phosphodiesterase
VSASSRRRRPFLDADRPLCFAHRGGAKLWPENTLAAFEASLELGNFFVETDVHMTRDGVLVAHHDERVEATTNGAGCIADMRFAELARLDAGYHFTDQAGSYPFRGRGAKIPALSEIFALSNKMRVNIEIKAPGRAIVRALWEFVERHSLMDRVLVASHDDRQVRRFRRYSSERVATSASKREAQAFWLATRFGLDRVLPVAFDALQVPHCYGGLTIVDRNFVRAAHRRGLQVHVWTVDDVDEMRALLDLGVDGVMSDRPDRFQALKSPD